MSDAKIGFYSQTQKRKGLGNI